MTADASTSDPARVEALCRRAAAGQADALEELLCVHHRRVLGFLKRKVGVQWLGKIEPEDVLQEAYVEAYKAMPRFEYQGEDSFYRWLSQIVDHRFFYHVRHWSAQKRDAAREVAGGRRSSDSLNGLLEQCLRDTQTPSEFLKHQDAAGALLGCLAHLPEDYRTVVQRLHLDQAPIATVAAEMGRSEDALRRLSGRALEKLRECLGRASRFLSRVG